MRTPPVPSDFVEDPRLDGTYDADGVDRSLCRWMLSLTPTERLEVAQGAIDVVASVRALPDEPR